MAGDELVMGESERERLESALDVRAVAMLNDVYGRLVRLADEFERRFYETVGDTDAGPRLCADSATNGGAVMEAFRAAVVAKRPPMEA